MGFCNRVEKEANHFSFNCTYDKCTAALIAIRDQIVIGTHSEMLFRDGIRTCFPRKSLSDKEVSEARSRDKRLKQANMDKVNASKYRSCSEFVQGDLVLVRNQRTSKFQPIFRPEPYIVLESDLKAKRIVLESTVSPQRLVRHPDDLKKYKKVLEEKENVEIDEMIG